MKFRQLKQQSFYLNNIDVALEHFHKYLKNKADISIVWEDNKGYSTIPGIVVKDPEIEQTATCIKLKLTVLGMNPYCKEISKSVEVCFYILDCIAILEGNIFEFKEKIGDGSLIVKIR